MVLLPGCIETFGTSAFQIPAESETHSDVAEAFQR